MILTAGGRTHTPEIVLKDKASATGYNVPTSLDEAALTR